MRTVGFTVTPDFTGREKGHPSGTVHPPHSLKVTGPRYGGRVAAVRVLFIPDAITDRRGTRTPPRVIPGPGRKVGAHRHTSTRRDADAKICTSHGPARTYAPSTRHPRWHSGTGSESVHAACTVYPARCTHTRPRKADTGPAFMRTPKVTTRSVIFGAVYVCIGRGSETPHAVRFRPGPR